MVSESSQDHPHRDNPTVAAVAALTLLAFCWLLGSLDIIKPLSPPLHEGWLPIVVAWGLGSIMWLVGRRHWSKEHQVTLSDVCVVLLAATAIVGGHTFSQLTTVLRPVALDEELPAWLCHANLPRWTESTLSRSIEYGCGAFGIALVWLAAAQRTSTTRLVSGCLLAGLFAALLMLVFPITGPFPPEMLESPALLEAGSASAAATPPRTSAVGLWCVAALASALYALWSFWKEPGMPWRLGIAGFLGLCVASVTHFFTNSVTVAECLGAVLVVGLSLLVDRAVHHSSAVTTRANRPKTSTARWSLAEVGLATIFFCSGFAALVYQVVYAKGLALTFGSTSHASTIVLATYMGGLALGSYLGGHAAEKWSRPVLGYALAELGVAALCAFSPFTLRMARALYVTLAAGSDPGASSLVGLQLGFGTILLLPPTLLMGLTLPLLTRHLLDHRGTLGTSAGLLYATNTLGAALGGVITGYLLLPRLGFVTTLYAAVGINVAVAGLAILLSRRAGERQGAAAKDTTTPASAPDDASALVAENATEASPPRDETTPPPPSAQSIPAHRWLGLVAAIQLTIGGFVTFGLETTSIHLLATVAGTSVYAFSLMLFAFLIGLSGGAAFARRWLDGHAARSTDIGPALFACQIWLLFTLVVGMSLWNGLPDYFASFGPWAPARSFAARELVRFLVCLLVMLPPALCIGAQYPIAMQAVGMGWPKHRLLALGRVSALNTVGNITGAIVVGFFLLPGLGSKRTLLLLCLICLLLAAVAISTFQKSRRPLAMAVAAVAAILLGLSPHEFDLTRLASGGNVYFQPQYYGTVVDHAESLDGGLTTVTTSDTHEGIPFKTLLTNGKFQGNDRRDDSGEMVAQSSFALCPLLHTGHRDRALVIGFGTGTTSRVLSDAGFARLDVVELSGDIVSLADRHFATINQSVIHRRNVHVHITDGRNYLLLDRSRYDLISIELSSIWFAGAANLYNSEFYALLAPRLAEKGVLEQWVQLHRLSRRDVVTIMATLRQHFAQVWLYFLGKQGVMVACQHDCAPNPETLLRLDSTLALRPILELFGGRSGAVLDGRLLDPKAFDALIADYQKTSGLTLPQLLSTDDNLYLEYSTPRGNVRTYDESLFDNFDFLARFQPPRVTDGTHLPEGFRK